MSPCGCLFLVGPFSLLVAKSSVLTVDVSCGSYLFVIPSGSNYLGMKIKPMS